MQQNANRISIQILGAAGTVTGSKYLVESNGKKILVDCGLFQGLKVLRLQNWAKLPVDASTIDCTLITHGHLDHTGYLPLLVKQGFKGSIYATQATIEIAELILKDSAKIQEEDATRANFYHYSRHKHAEPLYNTKEAEAVFPLFSPKPINQWIDLFDGISFRMRYNAHIIGSVFIELKINGKLLVFSGDVGREDDPLLRNPEKPEHADLLFIESTYGDRLHPPSSKQLLAEAVTISARQNGTIIIPCFAVERAQLLMYLLWELHKEKKIPDLPVYMDSPMGTHVLEVFQRYPEWHKLSVQDCIAMCKDVKIIKTQQETEQLARDKAPKIVIAGSGMASGGRVLTYFEHYLGDPNATILLVGYQAEGTRGRALLEGAKYIKMRGKLWPVKAKNIMVDGLSAHADQQGLLNWLNQLDAPPSEMYITHGEVNSSTALKNKVKQVYGWNATIPALNQTIVL